MRKSPGQAGALAESRVAEPGAPRGFLAQGPKQLSCCPASAAGSSPVEAAMVRRPADKLGAEGRT